MRKIDQLLIKCRETEKDRAAALLIAFVEEIAGGGYSVNYDLSASGKKIGAFGSCERHNRRFDTLQDAKHFTAGLIKQYPCNDNQPILIINDLKN